MSLKTTTFRHDLSIPGRQRAYGAPGALFCGLLFTLLFLGGCALSTQERNTDEAVQENSDFSCAYFYFLWGTHAEYEQRYPEALDAYEKALVCDASADYIRQKLPLLHLRIGDTDKARELLEKALQDAPEDTVQRALLARIFIQQKDTEGAREQYETIISYDPDNEQILFSLGALLSQTGNYDGARYYLKKVLQLDPNAYFAQVYLARIAYQLKEPDRAEYHYLEAQKLNWSAELSYEISDFYTREERYEDSIRLLNTVLENDEEQEQARIGIVQALLALDREEEAIAELSLAKKYSRTPEAISLVLSRLYLKNGETLKAQENLLAILQVNDSPQARHMLAVIYSDEGRFNEAISLLDGISPEQEEFQDALLLKVKILHQTGRTAEALSLMEGYLKREETRQPIFFVLAASLYQENGESERSLVLLERGSTLYPEDERLLFEYGIQLERTDRLPEAIDVMQQVIALNPDHAEALNFVGYSWADSDYNLEKALVYITKAASLKPGNGYIQDSLGWVYFKLGKYDRARKELLQALESLPEDPHIHDHLGDVYLALGQLDKARAAYQYAFETYDDEKKKDVVQKKISAIDAR